MAAKIRKGDRVIVMSGRDKGKRGEVISVSPAEGRAMVRGPKDNKPTRVGFKYVGEGLDRKKVRVSKRSGVEIDG
jgi:large subunit ribosomal protein L24